MKAAQTAIKERLLLKHKSIHAALRGLDTDNSGTISRDEIVAFLTSFNLIKRADYYSGVVSGEISMAVLDTLIEFVDSGAGAPVGATRAGGTSADGKIDYQEFTRILTADNIFEIAEKHDPMARFGVETAQNRQKLR